MQPNGYQPGPPRPNTYRPGPPQPRPARPGLIWAITAGVLAGALGVAALVFFLVRSSAGPGRSTTGQQAQSGTGQQQPALGAGQATHPAAVATTPVQQALSPTTPPTATSAVPTVAPTASPPPLTWTNYQDPSGFSINLPTGWSVSSRTSKEVWFTGPSPLGFTVVVEWNNHPQSDALADWRQQAAYKAQTDPTYQQVGIRRVSYRGYNAADWEFENMYQGEFTHVLDRGFVVDPGTLGYAIELYGPNTQWPQAYASMWNNLMTSFEPAS